MCGRGPAGHARDVEGGTAWPALVDDVVDGALLCHLLFGVADDLVHGSAVAVTLNFNSTFRWPKKFGVRFLNPIEKEIRHQLKNTKKR